MNVVGFCGYSGAGKTTLVEQLTKKLAQAGHRVSVIKHAHHDFDIDHEGKDSWRHRKAGAFEVVIASSRRFAKLREHEAEPTLHELIAELADCDWVLVEGFKHAAIPKIEVWRAANGKPALYPFDAFVAAVCTDAPAQLPVPTALPVLALGDADAVAAYLLSTSERYDYRTPEAARASVDADAGRGTRPAAGRRCAPAIG
jgi:molybdopterin-guanine dinucleotide biosynthesis adapter protein